MATLLTPVNELSCLGWECYQVFDMDVTYKVACTWWLVITKGHSGLWKKPQATVNQIQKLKLWLYLRIPPENME